MIATLSLHEERILQAYALYVKTDKQILVSSGGIVQYGQVLFGDHWGGKCSRNTPMGKVYPSMNGALGRLAKKGIMERVEWPGLASNPHYHRGLWKITEQGCMFLGLPVSILAV